IFTSGIWLPGLSRCELRIQPSRYSLVFGTVSAPSVVREARCVRSGPVFPVADVPRIVWHDEHGPLRKTCRPTRSAAVFGDAAGFDWAASQRWKTSGGSAKT